MRVSAWRRVAARGCGLLGVCVSLLTVAPGASAAQTCVANVFEVTCTFDFTGSEQTFAVPSNVTSVEVSTVGAPGGGSDPGAGGTAEASVTVAPNQTLYVEVGSAGTSATGGFNGGGAPGAGSTVGAGGGGGASDVRTVACGGATPCGASSENSRLVVAGGGGGSGAQGAQATTSAAGGAAGSGGTGGADASGGVHGGGGGGSGTSSGGVAGTGGAGSGGTAGTPGGQGAAGGGGAGGGETAGSGNAVGGGGGGGEFGGGGGGGGGFATGEQAAGGGGGGGSSLAPSGTIGVATSGEPASVTIRYELRRLPWVWGVVTQPAENGDYPLGSTVLASYTCRDDPNGGGVTRCQGPVASGEAIDTSTVGDHAFTVAAADQAGNTSGTTMTYVVYGPPSATVTAPRANGIYARGQVVATAFSCTEGPFGSGLSQCSDSNGTAPPASSTGPEASAGRLDTNTVGVHAYSVSATSADRLTGGAQLRYTVAGRPSISIAAPAARRLYRRGRVLKARYTCKDGRFGPGIRSCTGTVRRGARANTRRRGRLTFTVTAVSNDGQRTTRTITYRVVR